MEDYILADQLRNEGGTGTYMLRGQTTELLILNYVHEDGKMPDATSTTR